MSKGLGWLAGLVALVLIACLMACGSLYNPFADGLVLVASQYSSLIETFSFSLANGSIGYVSNPPSDTSFDTCILHGIPSSMVLDPAGTYAYTIMTANSSCPGSQTGIEAFKINTDGTIATKGAFVADPNPLILSMDLSGKYLFVAEGCPLSTQLQCPKSGVNSYSIGSGGTLTRVPGTFKYVPPNGFQPPDITAIMPTPSIFGAQNRVCSGASAPTRQFLYATDSNNNVVWEFGVDMSTGALQNPPNQNQIAIFPVQSVPDGVVVDPCNRFVYVSNYNSNQVSAFSICNGTTTQSASCPQPPSPPDGSLVPITGSPFSLVGSANGPGPMIVDTLGNYLFVLNLLSNNISPFAISPVNGSIASQPLVGVGNQPKAMVLRSDDSWLFVTNFNPPTLSEFAFAPSTGTLVPVPAITTDNYPWGVAVK